MPTAILVGWLGCQQKHLRPYERLYEDLGLDAITIIPEPRCIVESAFQSPAVKPPNGRSMERELPKGHLSMQDLAGELLAQIQGNQNPSLLFHVFSNGGCFLWESVRKILDLSRNESCEQNTRAILGKIEGRIRGVVFDSSPCWFGDGSNLSAALEYCSPSEQRAIEEEFGVGGQQHPTKNKTTRCSDYFSYLQNDPLDIPQLYLCSKDDPLCDYEKVLELVGSRRSQQSSPINVRLWNESQHCGHLRKHPQGYKETVNSFVQLNCPQSRL